MRRFALTTFAVLACAFATPAVADMGVERPQPNRLPMRFEGHASVPSATLRRDVRDIKHRIDQLRDSGILSQRDARRWRGQARALIALETRYGRDGLSQAERSELEDRALYLRSIVTSLGVGSLGGGR